MNEKDISELQEKAEKFRDRKLFIDKSKIRDGYKLMTNSFFVKFNSALNNFLLSELKNDYVSEPLHRLILDAGNHDAISDKTIVNELENCKKEHIKYKDEVNSLKREDEISKKIIVELERIIDKHYERYSTLRKFDEHSKTEVGSIE